MLELWFGNAVQEEHKIDDQTIQYTIEYAFIKYYVFSVVDNGCEFRIGFQVI